MKKLIAGILLGILCMIILGVFGICTYIIVQETINSHISLENWLAGVGILSLVVFVMIIFWKGINWAAQQFKK